MLCQHLRHVVAGTPGSAAPQSPGADPEPVAYPGDGLPEHGTGEWLANVSACPVPEISNAFARSRIAFHVVTGMLYPAEGRANRYYERAWTQINEWIQAANVMHELSYSRFGFLGHTYPGMLDMYSDFTMHHAQLGTHVEVLEMDDLQVRVGATSGAEIEEKIRRSMIFSTSRSRGATRFRSLSPTRRCSGQQRSPSGWISWSRIST